jgi:hypothetical protein
MFCKLGILLSGGGGGGGVITTDINIIYLTN